ALLLTTCRSFFLCHLPPPSSTLFPYTTLFRSELTGTVSDQNGAAIKDATVKISNPATGFLREVKTNSDGAYSAPSLDIGLYTVRSEEHTSELQSRRDLVCRLLLEKKKKKKLPE